jgi:DNA-binding NarL/FixJ family response regulator
MTTSPIRVILADDHAIVLGGLQRLFDSQPDFTVFDCCRDADEALAAVRTGGADVLILDLRMPGRTGLDTLRELSDSQPTCRTVLLTAAITDDEVIEAVRLGAQGIVLKESDPRGAARMRPQGASRAPVDRPRDHVTRVRTCRSTRNGSA